VLYTSSVAIWKRGWNQHSGGAVADPSSPKEHHLLEVMARQLSAAGMPSVLESPAELFQYLQNRINNNTSNNTSNFEEPSSYLSVLVGEFSGKSASDYNMPLEFHKRMYATFEKDSLEECLKIAMQALSLVVANSTKESNNRTSREKEAAAVSVVDATIEILSWEFGASAWLHLSSRSTLIRPPPEWAPYIVRPDFVGAIVMFHQNACSQQACHLAKQIRQLLLLLCSVSGIFQDKAQRKLYAQFFCEGSQQLVSLSAASLQQQHDDASAISALVFDSFSLVSRLLTNFRLDTLSDLPSFPLLLDALRDSGMALSRANHQESLQVQGDVNSMEHGEWREEALALMLEVIVLLCQDPWLRDQKKEVETKSAIRMQLNQRLGPLYDDFIACRREMVRIEEAFLVKEGEVPDEDEEEIKDAKMKEEMEALASLGRMCISKSLSTLGVYFQRAATDVLSSWACGTTGDITPEVAGLLKDVDLVVRHVGHLLTDENDRLPLFVEMECEADHVAVENIACAIRSLLTLMQEHGSRVPSSQSKKGLSSRLAQTFLWLLRRWVPSYVYSSTGGRGTISKIRLFWSVPEAANQVLDFCCWICLQYLQWHEDIAVLQSAANLLTILGKQNKPSRFAMKQSVHFQQLYFFHCISAGIADKAEATSKLQNLSLSINSYQSYELLPEDTRARVLTALMISFGDCDSGSESLFNDCMRAVQEQFKTKSSMVSSVALFYGLVQAIPYVQGEERITSFVVAFFCPLSELMKHYISDLDLCKQVLVLFCSYAETARQVKLTDDQMTSLLRATSELLKLYSTHHCAARSIEVSKSAKEIREEEENAYDDILCALKLLKNLLGLSRGGVSNVADVVFFGIQQLIPLMTQGLLSYPTLCNEYFSVVSILVKRFPEKIPSLPNDLSQGLLQSLQMGVNHHDADIAKRSLSSLEELHRANHVQSGSVQ